MPPEVMDATVDSSTTIGADQTGTDAASSAETLNTDQVASQPPFHEHPRFQELIGKNRQLEAAVSRLSQQLTSLQRGREGDQPSPEYVDAANALFDKVLPAHPKLKALLDLAERAPALTQSVESLTTAQRNGLLQAGRSQIATLAQTSKLPNDEASLNLIEEMVAGTIRRLSDGEARFLRGDLAVVKEAFEQVEKTFLSQLRREASASLAQSKQKTSRLPPAPRGGLPGSEGDLKLEPGKERDFTAALHKKALALLETRE